ncbi:hypothetical protein [Pontitalea aquivivens]|uniref:hypothetical protein n=1 Tax=Pontitalea aquivivens TaxID=3388663 RepID=UPI003970995B
MNYAFFGDSAKGYHLRRHNAALKEVMHSLSNELATGVKSDIGSALSGDFAKIVNVEHSLTSIKSFIFSANEAQQLAEAMQASLAALQSLISEIFPTLVSSSMSSSVIVDAKSVGSKDHFADAISILNKSTAGRYIFSGVASTTPPLKEFDVIFSSLKEKVSGTTNVEDFLSAVSHWFDAPEGEGGYMDAAYQGGESLKSFAVSAGERIAIDLTAASPKLRKALSGLAISALISEGAFENDPESQSKLLQVAGEKLAGSEVDIIGVRSEIGVSAATLHRNLTRNLSERSGLELARGALISVDPYDVTTALQAAQVQLETVYTLTSRLSRLSLLEFLR